MLLYHPRSGWRMTIVSLMKNTLLAGKKAIYE